MNGTVEAASKNTQLITSTTCICQHNNTVLNGVNLITAFNSIALKCYLKTNKRTFFETTDIGTIKLKNITFRAL